MNNTVLVKYSEVKFNKVFKNINESKKRYRVLKGSAGSGKSTNIAQDFIVKLMDMKYKGANLICVRETNESNLDSTFAELQRACFLICKEMTDQIWEFRRTPLLIRCKTTGNEIKFRGFKDSTQIEKVKSVTFANGKLTWIWAEEATQLQGKDVEILDDRLRGELPNSNLYYQMTFSFNPISDSHWIKSRFFDKEDSQVDTHHSTYLDNKYIDEAFHQRMLQRKERDPDGYWIYGLGNWGETGGKILSNYFIHEISSDINDYDGMALGTDFGFNHANATLLLGWKDGEVYVCKEFFIKQKSTSEIISMTRGLFNQELTMWCDSAEPDRIHEYRKAGYRAKPVVKEQGSIKAQIDWLKSRKLHIDPSCVNLIRELDTWKWQLDKKTDKYLDKPAELNDDAIAALRYGIEHWRKGATFQWA